MDRKKIYITREVPLMQVDLLRQHFDVEINPMDRTLTKEELIEKVKGKDALITQLANKIDKEVLDNADNLKVISNFAVGYNNIDIEEATKRGIQVTNTPGVLSDTTAELAWALMFAVTRRVAEGDGYVRNNKWNSFDPNLLLGQDVTGKTLGVIGAGRIGKAFAKKSLGFDMKILYHNRNRDEEFEKEYGAIYVDKETLLKEADFISIHVPLTDETKHSIGRDEFKMMKNTAIIINTSRGPVIDEKALVEALKEGQIWGAGLDVFENEPKIEEELRSMNNVVMTPHVGSASNETRTKMARLVVDNVLAVLNGNRAITPVNQI
ncbi:MAG: D-glycerate dehydrogenase [Firmicutes bacterium]|nr:D-glycerate dehydrogenase [Bacillota bacterium]